MKTNQIICLILSFTFFSLCADAQKVGVNNLTPFGTLDIKSNDSTIATTMIRGVNNAGRNIFELKNDGTLGLGTTIPVAKLHIIDGLNAGYLAYQPVSMIMHSPNAGIYLSKSNVAYAYSNYELEGPNGDVTFTRSLFQNFLIRNRNNGTGVTTTQFFVDGATGAVGINTVLPQQQLDVNGNMTMSGSLGIGISVPAHKLDVNGSIRCLGFKMNVGATNGWVLGTDATGNAAWVDPTTLFSSYWSSSAGNVWNTTNNIGIGTNAPATLLEVSGGAVLFSGATGTTPSSGAGTRLMWCPAKRAFRAGQAAGTEWDNANIGTYSAAFGYGNTASAIYSFAAGSSNTASGSSSTAFGASNTASGTYAMVNGLNSSATQTSCFASGTDANATGVVSIALGYFATASGDRSTAIGSYVSTNSHSGSMFLGDYSPTSTDNNSADNQMKMRFAGGFRLYSNSTCTAGVYMNAGDNGWTAICDRNRKENFEELNGEEILARIHDMPVTKWNYIGNPSVKYMGPMAQDFYKAFQLGSDSLGINSICIDGVNMAAIKALEERTEKMKSQMEIIDYLLSSLETLKEQNEKLAGELSALKSTLGTGTVSVAKASVR